MNRAAVLYALISAALFGISTPAAKVLVGSVHPAVLAGLLYCGAGIGIAVLRRALPSLMSGAPEVALVRSELPWLAGAILAGGVVADLPGFFQGTEMPNAGWWEALWPNPAGVLAAVGVKSGMHVIGAHRP